jgi:integrase
MASLKLKLKNKEYSNGEYPIVLQIIKNRRPKIISLGFFAKKKDWDSKQGLYKKSNDNSTKLNTTLEKVKLKALIILSEFEDKFRVTSNENLSVFEFWAEIISEMESSGKMGNADVNQQTANSIRKFWGDDKLSFGQVNVYFLEKYEVFLRKNGGTNGGIGVRMRALRAVYNRAIRRGFIKKNKYPFTDYKLSKLKSKSFKRALSKDAIKKIQDLDVLTSNRLINARNYFLFSFYVRGMNFADMMLLKWTDISGGRIYYTRQKTKINFIIKILPPAQEILDYYMVYGNNTKYVFPILFRENYSPKQYQNRKKKMLKQYNRDLKHIGALCGIEKSFTSYAARHSFANCLKQNGTPTDIISETMGHQDIKVTQAYLKDMGNTILDDACEVLLE